MDTIDAPAAPAGQAAALARRPARGSQSRLSPVLLWILAAALLFRIVTQVTDRDGGPSTLVRWMPAATVADSSRTGHRPILYDFTADWCPPCKVLDREGWNDPQIAGLVNGRFFPARIVDRQREEGRNTPEISALQQKYGVRAFPTLVVASADGREIAKFEGFRGRGALLKFLEESAPAGTGSGAR